MAQLHAAQSLSSRHGPDRAHDFNNLLTPIIGSLDLLRRQLPANEKALRQIDMALQAASRAASLVQRLLAFARRQDLQPRPVDVTELIKGMDDLVSRSIGPMIHVEFDLPDDSPPALIDPNQLELAVLNLAINARDAMPSGGRLRIASIRATAIPGSSCRGPLSVPVDQRQWRRHDPGTWLMRSSHSFDQGAWTRHRAWLSMVHGLAAQLGGALKLRARRGRGRRQRSGCR